MSTNYISSIAPTTTDPTRSSRAEDRARIAELAAEFESLLLTNVLRDMRSSGRWSLDDSDSGTLGAETFNQTIDVELSRYLANAGGFGLSQRLLSAFDALARVADAASTSGSSPAFASPTTTPASTTTTTSGSRTTSAREYTGRTGWGGLRLDAPEPGGSGAEWAGFNNDRALAGGDDSSVKDAFFRWTYGLSFNPAGKSKEDIGSFLRDNVASAREYGLNILDVNGEQVLIETEERGAEWVDVVVNAGGPGAKWQWLCQTDFGVMGGGELGDALAALRNTADGDARVRSVLTSTDMTGQGLLASLRAEATAAANGGGSFVTARTASVPSTPVELNPQARTVTSGYGWRSDPFSGATTFHRGVDLRGDEGDPVTSSGAGEVTFAGEDGGYGTSVVITHANGLSTRYAHLSAALVNVGDQILDGQVLGLVGRTGRATGPHLHYEVMVDGRAVNPLSE